MKRYFAAEEIESIVQRRKQGYTWEKLAKEVGMTPAGLRHHIRRVAGPIVLKDKVCPYCQKTYTPSRINCAHCGNPDCYLKHRQEYWQKCDRGARRGKKAMEKGHMKVTCIGNYCGGKTFSTPAVKDHGRIRPLNRICPTCRSRNQEYCMAWGGR